MVEELLPPDELMVVHDLEALKVMADPLRMRLIELLRAAPATVKELAARLEAPPKSLYYHIGLLDRHQLIRVVETRLVSGILEKRYRASAYLFDFNDLTGGHDGESAAQGTQGYFSSIFTLTAEEIRESIASGRIDPGGRSLTPDRSLASRWQLLQLSPTDADAFAAELEALVARFIAADGREAEAGRATYRFLQLLFPTYYRGAPLQPPNYPEGRP